MEKFIGDLSQEEREKLSKKTGVSIKDLDYVANVPVDETSINNLSFIVEMRKKHANKRKNIIEKDIKRATEKKDDKKKKKKKKSGKEEEEEEEKKEDEIETLDMNALLHGVSKEEENSDIELDDKDGENLDAPDTEEEEPENEEDVKKEAEKDYADEDREFLLAWDGEIDAAKNKADEKIEKIDSIKQAQIAAIEKWKDATIKKTKAGETIEIKEKNEDGKLKTIKLKTPSDVKSRYATLLTKIIKTYNGQIAKIREELNDEIIAISTKYDAQYVGEEEQEEEEEEPLEKIQKRLGRKSKLAKVERLYDDAKEGEKAKILYEKHLLLRKQLLKERISDIKRRLTALRKQMSGLKDYTPEAKEELVKLEEELELTLMNYIYKLAQLKDDYPKKFDVESFVIKEIGPDGKAAILQVTPMETDKQESVFAVTPIDIANPTLPPASIEDAKKQGAAVIHKKKSKKNFADGVPKDLKGADVKCQNCGETRESYKEKKPNTKTPLRMRYWINDADIKEKVLCNTCWNRLDKERKTVRTALNDIKKEEDAKLNPLRVEAQKILEEKIRKLEEKQEGEFERLAIINSYINDVLKSGKVKEPKPKKTQEEKELKAIRKVDRELKKESEIKKRKKVKAKTSKKEEDKKMLLEQVAEIIKKEGAEESEQKASCKKTTPMKKDLDDEDEEQEEKSYYEDSDPEEEVFSESDSDSSTF